MPSKPGRVRQLLPIFTQAVVGIAILLIVWLVIANLPMIDRIPFPLKFSLAELLKTAVLMSIVVVLMNFAGRLERRLNFAFPNFSEGGKITKLFICIISILITYFALSPLVIVYLESYDWIYHLLFLVGFLAVMIVTSLTIYANIEQIGQLFADGGIPRTGTICPKCGESSPIGIRFCNVCGTQFPEEPKAVVCSNCNNPLKVDAQFCPKCGMPVDKASAPPTQADVCMKCSSPLEDGAKFCPSCGQMVSSPKEIVEEEVPPQTPTCPSCGYELNEQAKFCPACGTPTLTQTMTAENN